MDENTSRLVRAAEAFDLVVVRKYSLRRAAEQLGVSHDTVRRDVAEYGDYLKSERTADLELRRVKLEAQMDDLYRRALETYDAAGPHKTLSKVAALNSATALFTHMRAIQGVDSPKEAKVEQSGAVRVMWDDGTDPTP